MWILGLISGQGHLSPSLVIGPEVAEEKMVNSNEDEEPAPEPVPGTSL